MQWTFWQGHDTSLQPDSSAYQHYQFAFQERSCVGRLAHPLTGRNPCRALTAHTNPAFRDPLRGVSMASHTCSTCPGFLIGRLTFASGRSSPNPRVKRHDCGASGQPSGCCLRIQWPCPMCPYTSKCPHVVNHSYVVYGSTSQGHHGSA